MVLAAPYPFNSREALSRVVCAGFATAIIDGLFSSVLSVAAYGSTVPRLFQGVASTVVDSSTIGGNSATALGILMHFCVAFGWAALFVLVVMRSAWVRGILASGYGALKVAAVYGPTIWMVMSLLVIPVLLRRAPTISFRWWVQFFGHFPFVGIPIVLCANRRTSRRSEAAATAGTP